MRLVVVSLLGLLLAACDQSPEQQDRDLCTAVCNCMSSSPALVQACIDDCIPDNPTPLPDACVDCIYQYSQTCSDLLSKCEPVCQDNPQP